MSPVKTQLYFKYNSTIFILICLQRYGGNGKQKIMLKGQFNENETEKVKIMGEVQKYGKVKSYLKVKSLEVT